jgi:hypothetical protein
VTVQMTTTARSAASRPAPRPGARGAFTEGAIILIALYTLVGAGIGSACGSLLLGMLFGLIIGFFAAAAILLICGAAQGAKSA